MTWLQRLLAPDDAPRLRPSDWLRFSGRASKGEFRAIFSPFLTLVAAFAAATAAIDALNGGAWSGLQGPLNVLAYGVACAGFFVLMAVIARRCHDFGRSAWWTLLYLVPPIPLIMIILCWAQNGQPHPNRFGPVPPERVRLW